MTSLPILRIGHRGAAGHAPENTLAAIRSGIALRADFVELDIQRTRDGCLVLMHDKLVDRTTDGHGLVTAMSCDEIQSLNASRGEHVPLLEEALAEASGHVGLVLETITPLVAPQILDAVRHFGFAGPVIYSSFLHSEILALRSLDAYVHTMALLEGIPVSPAAFAIEAKAQSVGLSIDSVTPQFVADLHHARLKVFVYTVNDPRQIEFARSLGVDAIISDFPERISP